MKTKTIAIPSDVESVLRQAEIAGNTLKLVGQLDRDLYLRTDKILRALGGKWDRKGKAHLFSCDARAAIGMPGCVASTDPFGDLSIALECGSLTVTDNQLFPTPPELAQRVIAEADIRPGHRVLEPSAGTGALLQAMWDSEKCWGNVVAVELNRNLAEALYVRFPGVGTLCSDFLEERPEVLEGFDRICMNPPFADGQDLRHVTHALGFLKPGGRLVAIMSAGVTFRQDRATRAFRDLVEERGGTIEELPEDSFKTAGTGVRAVLVTIDA